MLTSQLLPVSKLPYQANGRILSLDRFNTLSSSSASVFKLLWLIFAPTPKHQRPQAPHGANPGLAVVSNVRVPPKLFFRGEKNVDKVLESIGNNFTYYGISANGKSMIDVTKCRHFSEGRTDVHDKQRTGRPSVISDALLQRTEEKIRANKRLKLKELHQIIPEVSMKTLYEVVTVKLGYRKLCARWVPKLLTEEHKKKRMGFALDFLTRYAEAGD
ncbi:uncharacterized protein TNCV_812521 [Trichonephila clavipes]|nr:uncharacterized protein TNCV_812521 [Trichonephila clavipes]